MVGGLLTVSGMLVLRIVYGKKHKEKWVDRTGLMALFSFINIFWLLSILFLVTGIAANDAILCVVIAIGYPVIIAVWAICTRKKLVVPNALDDGVSNVIEEPASISVSITGENPAEENPAVEPLAVEKLAEEYPAEDDTHILEPERAINTDIVIRDTAFEERSETKPSDVTDNICESAAVGLVNPTPESLTSFGLVSDNPINTTGVEELTKYIKSLKSISGDTLTFIHRGAICVDSIHGTVDVYDTYLPSGDEYKTLYIRKNGLSNSSFVPKGFSRVEEVLQPTAQNDKKKKRVFSKVVLVLSSIVVVLGIILIFAIPEIKYQKAQAKFDKGTSYIAAIKMFEDLGDYKDSKKRIKEAKYKYVLKHLDNDNVTTYSYLKDLKKNDYKDSANIFKNLYEWKLSVVAINSSEDDITTHNSIIRRNNPIYFHIRLRGGEPNTSVRISVKSILPSGKTNEYTFTHKLKDGESSWYGWQSGLSSSGFLLCTFYDEDGNMIGGDYVEIQ